jgi:hypothetical protein
MHMLGPPDEEAIAGHPPSGRGLYACGVFRVDRSSLVRRLERLNSVHGGHDPTEIRSTGPLHFYVHDSTFECVAESFDTTVEQVWLDEEHLRTLQLLNGRIPGRKSWLRHV